MPEDATNCLHLLVYFITLFYSCKSWKIIPTMIIFNLLSSLPDFWLTGTLGVDFSSKSFHCQIIMCNIIKATPFFYYYYSNTRLFGSKQHYESPGTFSFERVCKAASSLWVNVYKLNMLKWIWERFEKEKP